MNIGCSALLVVNCQLDVTSLEAVVLPITLCTDKEPLLYSASNKDPPLILLLTAIPFISLSGGRHDYISSLSRVDHTFDI